MNNADLQSRYEKMHLQGPTAWFSDGASERDTILHMGEPWEGKTVLEIGCGEGELARSIAAKDARIAGMDYSKEAIHKAMMTFHKDGKNPVWCIGTPRENIKPGTQFDRVVMQGVLEHFDSPWTELDWIIRNLVKPGGDIITSSPCFVNPRGIVWMTLATLLDAPMSLTDLHFLHPWEFDEFARKHDLISGGQVNFCDESWGSGDDMIADFKQRLPKVFPDMDPLKIAQFLFWLDQAKNHMPIGYGATGVYQMVKVRDGEA